jgi:hypothetical protein
LVLRNKRDRFMLDYYATYDHDFPHVESPHHLIWCTVMEHIAYNNQLTIYNHWQVFFYEANLVTSQLAFIPNHMDHVINNLLTGYHDLPFYTVPSACYYETRNVHAYDTMHPTYVHREYTMSPQCVHPFSTSYTDHRENMLSQQRPLPPPPLQEWPIKSDSAPTCRH